MLPTALARLRKKKPGGCQPPSNPYRLKIHNRDIIMGNINPRSKRPDPEALNREVDQVQEEDLPAATLDDVFMVYTYDHRKKEFVHNTLIFGEERAEQIGKKFADGCKGASEELDKEISDIKDDCRTGFITIKEATAKVHEVYKRYECDGWDEVVRSKTYPETGVSLGVVDIETFLHLVPHEHLLDYALNLSEKAFLG